MKVLFNNSETSLRIKGLRLHSKLSIDDLSVKIGISKSLLYKYERGLNIPSISNVIKICNFYNVKVDDLIIYKVQ